MDILTVIQSAYPKLSNKEQQIADYILNQKSTIKNMNISVLAQKADVSNGMITRFCKKIGCKNFADLKIQLSSLKTLETNEMHNTISAFTEVHDYYKKGIDQTNRLLSSDHILKVSSMLREAQKIYIYGVGSSGLTATEFQLRLSRMGFCVQSITDSHLMLINSSIISKSDLVIAISISGQTSNIVKAVKVAKKKQCKIISFTSFAESVLAKNSDYCINVSNTLFIDKERFINSQFSVMYAIDILCSMLLKDKTLKNKMQITVNTIIKNSHIKA